MKIKVKPEGREGLYIVEAKEIIKWLQQSELKNIHCFVGTPPMLIGADWDKESVIHECNKAERIAVATGTAFKNNMSHALAVISDNKLRIFDIGELTEENLIINN